MRGLKAKTMRRVARGKGLPLDRDYRAIKRVVEVDNPAFGVDEGATRTVHVERLQCVLGRCERSFYHRLKLRCPKNSFFGVSLAYYRSGGVPEGLRNATITILPGPPA